MSRERPHRAPDHDIWDQVARSVTPLARRASADKAIRNTDPTPVPACAKRREPVVPQPRAAHAPPPFPRLTKRPPPIEDRLLRSLRRGQTPIDMRIDLHGETQIRAHRVLDYALGAAQARGARIILVITGTGLSRRRSGEEDSERAPTGILRRRLPEWLSLPPLAERVLGLSSAHQGHGGAGAFYVLLRRIR